MGNSSKRKGADGLNMGFVLIIILTVWILGILGKDMNHDKQMKKYKKEHPPENKREEFFRCFELYLQYAYINPEEHKDPALEAAHDARLELLKKGFRPSTYGAVDCIDEYDRRLYQDFGVVCVCDLSGGPKISVWKRTWSSSESDEESYNWDKKYNEFVDYYWDTVSKIKNIDFSIKKEKIDQTHPQYPYYSYAKHNNLI